MADNVNNMVFKQELEEENCLYPFVCGICGYRFNRMNVYCQHFEMHSDMVTSEYFHSCQSVDEADDVRDLYDTSARNYSCGVCSKEFATLCLLHDHFCQKIDSQLYIIDTDKKKGIPKGRRCVGSVFTGAMAMPEDGEIVKTEIDNGIEEDGDDDMEYEEILDEEMQEGDVNGSDKSSSVSKSLESSPGKVERNASKGEDKGIAVQKITVSYGSHSATYNVNMNDGKDEKGKIGSRDVGVTATESEADEDMSDLDVDRAEHSYISSGSESPNKKAIQKRKMSKKRLSISQEDSLFDAYEKSEDFKARRRDSIPVAASEIKGLIAKAIPVDLNESDGVNLRVYCPVCNREVLKSYLFVSSTY